MYKRFLRPLLFLINPECVHHLIIGLLRFFLKSKHIKRITKSLFSFNSPEFERTIFGLTFKNPVGLAAGFDKNAAIYKEMSCFGFSFIEIGTVTPLPQAGNIKPRLFRLIKDKALINRMGFNNMGVEEAIKNLKNRDSNTIIGGNIGKNTSTANVDAVKDYVLCFNALYDYVDYFVVNVSCPNISDLHELQDQKELEKILGSLMELRSEKSIKKPVLLKISPDLNENQLDEVIEVVDRTGIHGIVATNTTITRKNLRYKERYIQKIGNGGLSGKPLKERSTEVIRYIYKKSKGKIPIIGAGGIMSPQDAKEKLQAGASLVEIYTGFIYEGPAFAKRINKYLAKYLEV